MVFIIIMLQIMFKQIYVILDEVIIDMIIIINYT